jgi:ABC-2 type transport system permease protein
MLLYLRLISIHLRSQLQYRLSFVLDIIGTGFVIFTEFITFVLVFSRFGSIGGWGMGEVAFLYGLAELSFGTMDMIFSGYDPAFFGTLIRRGSFDQMLLRPISLPLQVFTSAFMLRRIGRISVGVMIFAYSLSLNHISWTWDKLLYLPIVYISTVVFFGGLFVIGATLCFWTVESVEVINIFTYGGTTLVSYPMHIYQEWLRFTFIYIVPAALLIYYPALYFLDKPDPLRLPAFMPFLAPLAGFGVLAVAFGLWWIGVRAYTSTGT